MGMNFRASCVFEHTIKMVCIHAWAWCVNNRRRFGREADFIATSFCRFKLDKSALCWGFLDVKACSTGLLCVSFG